MKYALAISAALLLATAHAGDEVQLPGLRVDGAQHSVTAAGHIALTNGILEFLAVETGGRDYESLLTLTCRPSALKFALLLVGLTEGETTGTVLRLDVEWAAGGKTNRVPAESLLLERRTGRVPSGLPFIFTGSFFGPDLSGTNQIFHADLEQSHIALWWQPSALINVRDANGNPYRGDDQGFEVNSKAVPPVGTPIQLLFRRRE